MSTRNVHNRIQGASFRGDSQHARQVPNSPWSLASPVPGKQRSAAGTAARRIALRQPGDRRERLEPYGWVAEAGGCVLGFIGMVPEGNGTVRVRWLRVESEWGHTAVAGKLIRLLREHCSRHGYLQVVAEAALAPAWFWRLFQRGGFRMKPRQEGIGTSELEFVLDLKYLP